jgi:hypothetical protein
MVFNLKPAKLMGVEKQRQDPAASPEGGKPMSSGLRILGPGNEESGRWAGRAGEAGLLRSSRCSVQVCRGAGTNEVGHGAEARVDRSQLALEAFRKDALGRDLHKPSRRIDLPPPSFFRWAVEDKRAYRRSGINTRRAPRRGGGSWRATSWQTRRFTARRSTRCRCGTGQA